MKFTASVTTFNHSHKILNKSRNVNFGGTENFLEVQGEGPKDIRSPPFYSVLRAGQSTWPILYFFINFLKVSI